jgi:hypothetical protein
MLHRPMRSLQREIGDDTEELEEFHSRMQRDNAARLLELALRLGPGGAMREQDMEHPNRELQLIRRRCLEITP